MEASTLPPLQAIVTGKGPIDNWLTHLDEPFKYNGFTAITATKFTPGA